MVKLKKCILCGYDWTGMFRHLTVHHKLPLKIARKIIFYMELEEKIEEWKKEANRVMAYELSALLV